RFSLICCRLPIPPMFYQYIFCVFPNMLIPIISILFWNNSPATSLILFLIPRTFH
ncbi:hypothetical protein L9F63_002460, partial [Diploptera punctata]